MAAIQDYLDKDQKKRAKIARNQRAAKRAKEKAARRAQANKEANKQDTPVKTPPRKVTELPKPGLRPVRVDGRYVQPTQQYQGSQLFPNVTHAPPGRFLTQRSGTQPNATRLPQTPTQRVKKHIPATQLFGTIPKGIAAPPPGWVKTPKPGGEGWSTTPPPGGYGGGTTSSLPGMPSFNVDELLAQQFDPQVAALSDAESRLRGQHGISDDAIRRMYLEMAGDIKNAGAGLASNYDTAIKNVGTANDAAQAGVAANYDANAAQQEAMMRRLGIEAAAPDVLAPGTQNESFMNSLIEMGQQGTQNMLGTQKASALAYNTANENNAREGGAAERANLAMQFNKTLGDIAAQRYGIESERGKARTDLGFQVWDRSYQMDQDAADRAERLAQIEAEAEAARAEAAAEAGRARGENMTDYERAFETAVAATGSQARAKDAMNLIRTVAYSMPTQAGVKMSPRDFARAVNAANRGGTGLESQLLTDLAVRVYPELFG